MALHDLSLPDSLAVTDAIAAVLESFAPALADAVAAADAIMLEATYHVELADVAEVTDELAAERSQVAGEIHVELADAVAAADVLEALLFDGLVHTVTSVSPERGRAGDTITIEGTGFSAANNNVRLDNTACTILSQSRTKIVITQPTTFNVTEGFAVLQVNNFDNNRFSEVPFWIRAAIADLETRRLPDQEPGPEEFAAGAPAAGGTGAVVDSPTRAEARMWERMATMVDFLLRDTLTEPGDIYVRSAAGLAKLDGAVGNEEPGQRLVSDSAQAEGVRWGRLADLDLPYGLQLAAGTTSGTSMIASGVNTDTGSNIFWIAARAGTIDAAYAYQQSSVSNTDRLDRVRILVNAVEQYDSGTGLAIAHKGRHFVSGLSIAVAVGDRVELEVTKTGTSETMDLLGAVRMRTT